MCVLCQSFHVSECLKCNTLDHYHTEGGGGGPLEKATEGTDQEVVRSK